MSNNQTDQPRAPVQIEPSALLEACVVGDGGALDAVLHAVAIAITDKRGVRLSLSLDVTMNEPPPG